ncbi:hypothetical protein Vadar_017638 [Vaccinium darrowii]|uniref:Uncharacterized protein n=1 Tax=Vaccinium darrowii TaxID=229202 RepID=A0ACB7YE22_9ERIC|nr:hypothetical protein Vadar_017638 [Vaccinium darrowii]
MMRMKTKTTELSPMNGSSGGGGRSGHDGEWEVRPEGMLVQKRTERARRLSGKWPNEMWPSLIRKAKEGGLDVIQTYVFWNLHEPQPGKYDFSGRRDIVRFIKKIQAHGLYASLRIGPYIESEWSYGGLPFWLHDIPGIVFRSDNEPFKFYMKNFTTLIVNMMKSERLYASQGGPIILSQIENEYQNVERAFHERGPPYVRWAAKMAVGLETGVPWNMCKQDDAPGPVINSCNGMKCGQTFLGPNSPNKPSIWSENWTTFYQLYGKNTRTRSPEDIAYQVALFISKKYGSFINYYMYHGGTNFGRTAAAYVPTSYYDLAPLDEYGLIQQPKWGHLKDLHAAIKLCSEALLRGTLTSSYLGEQQEAVVFQTKSGECAAFLMNNGSETDELVVFQNSTYGLPPSSISILPDCKNVAFNTAQVSAQYNTRSRVPVTKFNTAERWEQFRDVVPNFDDTSLRSDTLLEQMNTTQDTSDYLWYTFRFQGNCSNDQPVLNVNSLAHVLHVFVNGVFVGSAHGTHTSSITLETKVPLNYNEMNNVSLLSVMVGLPVGLLGEKLKVFSDDGHMKVRWSRLSSPTQPLTWYKTTFDAPCGTDPVALYLGSMGKGEAWVNGQSIGRYWVSFTEPAGNPTQTWYNVPRSFLRRTGNLLVLLDEEYGNPLDISIGTVSITKVCGHVYEEYPGWIKPKRLQLQCPRNKKISKIIFASFGTPSGGCGSYAIGSCHSSNSRAIVEKACLWKRKCSIRPSYRTFRRDPCPGIPKALLVDAQCE